MKRIKRPKFLQAKIKPPAVLLARQMEETLHAAGMPNPYTVAEFSEWHNRLVQTDMIYASAWATYQTLTGKRQ